MTKNKLFREAIGNESLQRVLADLWRNLQGDRRVEKLLILARGAARVDCLDLRFDEIADMVGLASGVDLAIILGTYAGEIPVTCKNFN